MSSAPMRHRPPSEAELEGIAAALSYSSPYPSAEEVDEARGHIAACVVVDGYMPDGPGYTGPVALVLCTGGPELVFSLTWDAQTGVWEIANDDRAK